MQLFSCDLSMYFIIRSDLSITEQTVDIVVVHQDEHEYWCILFMNNYDIVLDFFILFWWQVLIFFFTQHNTLFLVLVSSTINNWCDNLSILFSMIWSKLQLCIDIIFVLVANKWLTEPDIRHIRSKSCLSIKNFCRRPEILLPFEVLHFRF